MRMKHRVSQVDGNFENTKVVEEATPGVKSGVIVVINLDKEENR